MLYGESDARRPTGPDTVDLQVSDVRLSEAYNNALEMETPWLWPEARRLPEIKPGVTISCAALHPPYSTQSLEVKLRELP